MLVRHFWIASCPVPLPLMLRAAQGSLEPFSPTLISSWCRSSASSISRSRFRSSVFFSSSSRRVISQ